METISNGSWETCGNYFVREKEKCTNKGTDNKYVANFYTLYNLSLPNFTPNFKILSQLFIEISLPEKVNIQIQCKQTLLQNRQNNLPHIICMHAGYNEAAVANVAAVAVVDNAVIAVINVVEIANVAAVAIVNVAESVFIYVVAVIFVNFAAVVVVNVVADAIDNVASVAVIKNTELTDYLLKLVLSMKF